MTVQIIAPTSLVTTFQSYSSVPRSAAWKTVFSMFCFGQIHALQSIKPVPWRVWFCNFGINTVRQYSLGKSPTQSLDKNKHLLLNFCDMLRSVGRALNCDCSLKKNQPNNNNKTPHTQQKRKSAPTACRQQFHLWSHFGERSAYSVRILWLAERLSLTGGR